MSVPKSDLDKIYFELKSFFNSKKIRNSLEIIHEAKIYGWEKWRQTEFSIYLAMSDSIAEWDMEHRFYVDRRTAIEQVQLSVDIGFCHKNNTFKNGWYFIEFKQAENYKKCIDLMCIDALKVLSSRDVSKMQFQIQYIACAGIFPSTQPDNIVLGYAERALKEANIISDGLHLEKISKYQHLIVF